MINWIKSLFINKNTYKIQSFTYYIPAPGARKNGYREKQFDKVFYHFINQGYEILNVQTERHSGQEGSGMWIIYTVRATNEQASKLNLDDFFMDQISNESNHQIDKGEKEEIEGLYYID